MVNSADRPARIGSVYWNVVMVQLGGFGVSVGRQYYHAKKRSDETPLEYLFRLKMAAIRAKISFREGSSATRREHVEHFYRDIGWSRSGEAIGCITTGGCRYDGGYATCLSRYGELTEQSVGWIESISPTIGFYRGSSFVETSSRCETDPTDRQ